MAYNQYTSDQINSFIKQRGLESDHWGQYNALKQYNVDPAAFDAARGLAPGTAAGWSANAQQQLAGPIADTRGLADSNPQMAYALAQQRGYTPGQADSLYGKDQGTSAGWMQANGYGGAPAAGDNPYLQIGGTPTQAANTPQQYPGVGASTAGSTPVTGNATGTMTPGPMPDFGPPPDNSGRWVLNGTGWVPAGNAQQQRNPYMPAGGAGSNFGNDPRRGTGNQNFSGLSNYLWDNPSTLAMGNEVTRQVNNNLQRNVLPGIGDQFSASGTYGGSRHGVAEGLAVGESMSGLAGALANLYGNQFNQDRGYGLQSDALDFNIHRGNLQDMRQGQQDQIGFLGQMANWGQQGVGVANQTRDRPFTDWQRFVQPASQMAGLGGQQTQNLQGNPYLGALGGYLAGSKTFGG